MSSTTPESRRISRRGLLGASAAVGIAASTAYATVARSERTEGSSGIRLRWLGNNGWEIKFADTTVLIDPWLTRFKTGTYSADGVNPRTPVVVNKRLIDSHRLSADQILVTHGHYDHLPDVPYLAARTGATVFGTETHLNMMRAMGAPDGQLSEVRGGEYLQYDGYTIQVLRSLHSMPGPRAQVPFPGTRPGGRPLPPPRTIADLVEGETLAYQLSVDGFSMINFGGSNFDEASVRGLSPDLAFIQPGGGTIHQYIPRLMKALDYPSYVVATHWDDFDYPLSEPARDWGGLKALETAVLKASPDTKFIVIDHLETFVP